MRRSLFVSVALMGIAAPAQAREFLVDVPAGSVADVAIAVARQTRSSILVTDPAIASRRAPAIRGRMSTRDAVIRLAGSVRARVVATGGVSWRIVRATAAPVRPMQAVAPQPPRTKSPPVTPVTDEEIVVVASKRETKIGEMPAQVSVLTGAELEFGGVGGTEKITQRLASVASTHLGSGRNKLFIRGIADSSFTGPTQATVGQYLGDLRLSYNAPDPDLRLSDLARVEVLEGPQGTLYGAGSLGGIIRLVPNAPDLLNIEGSAMIGGSLTQHGAGSADASAMLNLPLSPDLAGLRIVIDATSEGGYIDKPALGRSNVNRSDILAGRATLRVVPAPGWTVDLIGLAQSTSLSDSQYASRAAGDHESLARIREGSSAHYAQGQLVLSGRLGSLRLRSTTGLVRQELDERYDATGPEGPDRIFVQGNDTRMVAHETRLWLPLEDRRLSWVGGLSLVDNRTTLSRSLNSALRREVTTGVLNTTREATVFGEVAYRLRPGLIGTVGARYTLVRLGGGAEDVPLTLALERSAIIASREQSAFLPSAALVAQLFEETSFYVRYQEGFRPGGLAIENEFVRRFEQDRATALEIGLRHGRPGRGAFDGTVSLSYTRWADIQADYIDDAGLPTTANIGDGRVWTLSANGSAALSPELRLTAGLTVNKSRIDQSAVTAFRRTDHIPNIADFAGRMGLDYTRTLANSVSIAARAWASYVGQSRLGVGPELGDPQGDYLDSAIAMRVGDARMGATVSVTNLADVGGNRFSLGTPFSQGREQVTPLRPRTVRIGLDYAF